jgi:hypothetical protein
MRAQSTRPATTKTEQRYVRETTNVCGAKNDRSIPRRIMSGRTATAPALAPEIILPRIAQCCLPDRVCRSLRQGSDFQRLEFRCQQMAFVKDFAESCHNIPTSINALARAFDCPQCRIETALAHGLDGPDTADSTMPSMKIANGKSSTGSGRRPSNRQQSGKERSGSIAHLNSNSHSLEAG